MINPVAANVAALYPNGNVSPSVYTATVVGANDDDQTGIRVDLHQSDRSQFFSRYSWFTGYNINPVSVRGTDLPGYPTRDDFTANSLVAAHTALPSSSMTNSFEFSFFRYEFLFDQRLNKTPPRALGFNFDSASQIGQGPPFFNLAGYSPVGGAITGPRTSAQNTYEVHDGLSLLRGKHSLKVGGEFRRNQLNMFQSIAPNAFFIFASSFPTNESRHPRSTSLTHTVTCPSLRPTPSSNHPRRSLSMPMRGPAMRRIGTCPCSESLRRITCSRLVMLEPRERTFRATSMRIPRCMALGRRPKMRTTAASTPAVPPLAHLHMPLLRNSRMARTPRTTQGN
jgi:hypothetical protein